MEFLYRQYIDDVTNEKIVACKWVKLAVKRHIDDLEKLKDPKYPFYFEPKEAERFIEYAQLQKHISGEWASKDRDSNFIKLEPWQQFVGAMVFGWRRKSDKKRRFNHAYISMARKNAKSTYAAIMGTYCSFVDSPAQPGAENYTVATKREQAKIVWSIAKRQINANKFMKQRIKTQALSLSTHEGNKFQPLGQDSDTEDGLSPHFTCIDEYHAHKDATMYNVIDSAMGARSQPLLLVITTAGFSPTSPCKLEEERAQRILEGTIIDDRYFAAIYTLDEGDDWTQAEYWVKANPNLGISVYTDYVASQCQTAKDFPSKQNNFKTKNLNIWTQSIKSWVTMAKWQRCCGLFDPKELDGRVAYAGLDLSTALDLTAYVLCFPPITLGEKFKALFRFYLPEVDIYEHGLRDRVDYVRWNKAGLITLTPGEVIDYDFIEADILADAKRFRIPELSYDPWKAQEIVNHISGYGIDCIPIQQTYKGMAIPTHEMERAIYSENIATNNNEIMNWQISCVEPKYDRQGNVMLMKPERSTAGKRIDGVIAMIMSYYRAYITPISVYESRGVRYRLINACAGSKQR